MPDKKLPLQYMVAQQDFMAIYRAKVVNLWPCDYIGGIVLPMNSEKLLDFDVIRERLAAECSSKVAKEMAMELEPLTDPIAIKTALDETVEAVNSLNTEIEQPIGGTRDFKGIF